MRTPRIVNEPAGGDHPPVAADPARWPVGRPAVAPPAARCLRILHVFSQLGVGGAELVAAKLARGLGTEQFEQRFCAVRSAAEDFEKKLGGAAFALGRSGPGFQFAVFDLARVMRAFRPHIVHSRNWGAIEATVAARLARVPVLIHSEHGYEPDMFNGLPLRQRLFRRLAYQLADAVFTVTRELRDYHARQAWISPDRIRVIHNGVDSERYRPQLERRLALRRNLRLPARGFVAGSVGRIVAIKDYPTLLRAVETLLAQGLDASLLLVGQGPELDRLKSLAASSPLLRDRAIFPGPSDDVPALLGAMDVFVLPSVREGMSNALLEAMAAGLPVIAMRVGGNPEIIEDGRSGWLLPPGDAEVLADRLGQLAASPALRERLGSEARRRVLECFTLERMLAEYRTLYLELAGRRGLWKDD
jgi:sugar transferase (PEP-CTERM/EpsH1 system associated)